MVHRLLTLSGVCTLPPIASLHFQLPSVAVFHGDLPAYGEAFHGKTFDRSRWPDLEVGVVEGGRPAGLGGDAAKGPASKVGPAVEGAAAAGMTAGSAAGSAATREEAGGVVVPLPVTLSGAVLGRAGVVAKTAVELALRNRRRSASAPAVGTAASSAAESEGGRRGTVPGEERAARGRRQARTRPAGLGPGAGAGPRALSVSGAESDHAAVGACVASVLSALGLRPDPWQAAGLAGASAASSPGGGGGGGGGAGGGAGGSGGSKQRGSEQHGSEQHGSKMEMGPFGAGQAVLRLLASGQRLPGCDLSATGGAS